MCIYICIYKLYIPVCARYCGFKNFIKLSCYWYILCNHTLLIHNEIYLVFWKEPLTYSLRKLNLKSSSTLACDNLSSSKYGKLVEHLNLDFGSGYDLIVCEPKPHIGLCADSMEPAWHSLSPSLSVPPLLSLSKINSKK